jgi:hypothetical protein
MPVMVKCVVLFIRYDTLQEKFMSIFMHTVQEIPITVSCCYVTDTASSSSAAAATRLRPFGLFQSLG